MRTTNLEIDLDVFLVLHGRVCCNELAAARDADIVDVVLVGKAPDLHLMLDTLGVYHWEGGLDSVGLDALFGGALSVFLDLMPKSKANLRDIVPEAAKGLKQAVVGFVTARGGRQADGRLDKEYTHGFPVSTVTQREARDM